MDADGWEDTDGREDSMTDNVGEKVNNAKSSVGMPVGSAWLAEGVELGSSVNSRVGTFELTG